MTRARPPALRLDPAKVAAWRLERQHLSADAAATRPEEVAYDLVGVQAQVTSAAALSVAVRTDGVAVDAVPVALAERRLVRSWAMRGTLHLFAADDLPTVVAALRRREMWRRPAWLRYFGLTEAEVEATIEAIGEILADGRPRTRAELSDELRQRLGPTVGEQVRSSWGTILKPAADRGYLCHATGEGTGVTFTRPDVWLGTWREEDPDTALVDVVRRYLRAYGPADPNDVRLWWGTQPAMVRPALRTLAEETVEVELGPRRGLLAAVDVEAIEQATPIRGSVRLLGPFDPLVVRGGLRDQLIPAEHLPRVSRTAGWISPVVLVDGVVAGVWTSERVGSELRLTVDPFAPSTAARRRELEREAERLAARQGLSVRLELGPVYATGGPADGESLS